jgi:hypothetical protein
MSKFVFAYRMRNDYIPGQPGATEAWGDFFNGLGDHVVTTGNPVFESTSLGNCGPDTHLGGYTIITADGLESAVTLAKGCPALAQGAGVEVGVIAEL